MNLGAAIAPTPPAFAEHAPCLLVNPRSFGAARACLSERAAALARACGVELIEAADPSGFAAATDRVVATGQPLLLLGGDGTVQAVVDRLAALPSDVPRPQLMVFGGGRSNMIAADLGGRGAVLSKLEAALHRWRHGPALGVQLRCPLRIEQPSIPARHGFVLCAGLLDLIIRACHADRERGGSGLRHGEAGTAWSILKLVLRSRFGRAPSLDALEVAVADGTAMAAAAHVLLATTLQGHATRLHPFARRGTGAIRFTALAARGPGLWLRLPWLATGRFTASMDPAHGYLSGGTDRLRVLGLSRYTLDGEEFDADPARPFVIGEGRPLAFLTL